MLDPYHYVFTWGLAGLYDLPEATSLLCPVQSASLSGAPLPQQEHSAALWEP